jgi:prepilin-type processing-associated H-X9-DG protein
MLVIDGRTNPRIRPVSTSSKVRNGVGMADDHTVIFAISDEPVTFWEFARLFRDHLGARNALFLDGSISSLYAPTLRRLDTLYPMGPIVAGFARKSSGN